MKGREEIGETVDLKRCTAAAEPTRTAGAPSAPTKKFRTLKLNNKSYLDAAHSIRSAGAPPALGQI